MIPYYEPGQILTGYEKEIRYLWMQLLACRYNIYEVNNHHQCFRVLPKPRIIRPFAFQSNFFGCTECGKYHFCHRESQHCEVLHNPIDAVAFCRYSGQVLLKQDNLEVDLFSELEKQNSCRTVISFEKYVQLSGGRRLRSENISKSEKKRQNEKKKKEDLLARLCLLDEQKKDDNRLNVTQSNDKKETLSRIRLNNSLELSIENDEYDESKGGEGAEEINNSIVVDEEEEKNCEEEEEEEDYEEEDDDDDDDEDDEIGNYSGNLDYIKGVKGSLVSDNNNNNIEQVIDEDNKNKKEEENEKEEEEGNDNIDEEYFSDIEIDNDELGEEEEGEDFDHINNSRNNHHIKTNTLINDNTCQFSNNYHNNLAYNNEHYRFISILFGKKWKNESKRETIRRNVILENKDATDADKRTILKNKKSMILTTIKKGKENVFPLSDESRNLILMETERIVLELITCQGKTLKSHLVFKDLVNYYVTLICNLSSLIYRSDKISQLLVIRQTKNKKQQKNGSHLLSGVEISSVSIEKSHNSNDNGGVDSDQRGDGNNNINITREGIINPKKITRAFLFSLFSEPFVLNDSYGIRIDIWYKDPWLTHVTGLYKQSNGLIRELASSCSIIREALASYNWCPLWLRESIFNNVD